MDKQRFVTAGKLYAVDGGGTPIDPSEDAFAIMGLRHLVENDPECLGLFKKVEQLIDRVLVVSTTDERTQLRLELEATFNETVGAITDAAGRLVFEADMRPVLVPS